jgi:hypothetical protein
MMIAAYERKARAREAAEKVAREIEKAYLSG